MMHTMSILLLTIDQGSLEQVEKSMGHRYPWPRSLFGLMLRFIQKGNPRAVIFDPLTFIEKLCALVPPPRANLVTYHGVLAPNAAWRRLVVPDPWSAGLVTARKRCRTPVSEDAPAAERKRRYTWAQLMRRVFKLDVLECPFCKGRRKLIALITDAPVIRAILDCLGLPSDPPGLAPTRWPP